MPACPQSQARIPSAVAINHPRQHRSSLRSLFHIRPSDRKCAGEIYNYKALGADHAIPLTTGSDCEVLLPLYHLLDGDATTLARCLDGVFAIVIIDLKRQVAVVMRDPYGVRPLFRGRVPSATSPAAAASGPAGVFAAGDRLVFGSELKSLVPCGAVDIQPFPPGCVHTYDLGTGQLLKECK